MSIDNPKIYIQENQLVDIRNTLNVNKILSKVPIRNLLTGRFQSKVKGRGLIFEEIRDYHIGDDIRYMDWKATLKMKRPQIKSFSEEKDRPVLLLVDQCQTMFFGTKNKLKSVVACEVAALITWFALDQKERVGGLVFHNEEFATLSPSNSKGKCINFLGLLKDFNNKLSIQENVNKEKRFSNYLPKLNNLATQNSLIVLISDFFKIDDDSLRYIHRMAAKNDLVIIQVYDDLEMNIPKNCELNVSDGEQIFKISNESDSKFIDEFNEFKTNRQEEGRSKLVQNGINIIKLNVNEDITDQLKDQLT